MGRLNAVISPSGSRQADSTGDGLQARLKSLRRAELDLQQRVQARIVQAEAEGRWVPSDPMYQRLSSVLRQVRTDLRETEQEV